MDLEVDELGPSLRYATATVTKTNRGITRGATSTTTTAVTEGEPRF